MASWSSMFGSSRPPAAIVQANAVNGYTADASAQVAGGKIILSGALTANALSTILSLTGAGEVQALGVGAQDGTSRTLRCQLIVDGVTVYDYTSSAITGAGQGAMLVGSQLSAGAVSLSRLPFNTSLVLKIASSLSETDKLAAYARYWTY